MLMMSTLSESTSETPETAASPTFVIIMTAARPTVIASSCSKMSGTINCRRAEEEKIGFAEVEFSSFD
jgi:hypothetical protein